MGLTTVSSVALTHGVYQNHDSLGGVRAASETTSYTAGCLAPSPRESGVPKEDPALHICRRGDGSAIYAVGRGVPPSRMVGTAFHRRPPRAPPPRAKSARQPLTVDGEQLCRRLEPHGRAHACAFVCLEGVMENLARRVIPQRRRKDHAVVLVKGNEMFFERGGVGRRKAKRVVGRECLLLVFRHDETSTQRGRHVQACKTKSQKIFPRRKWGFGILVLPCSEGRGKIGPPPGGPTEW